MSINVKIPITNNPIKRIIEAIPPATLALILDFSYVEWKTVWYLPSEMKFRQVLNFSIINIINA